MMLIKTVVGISGGYWRSEQKWQARLLFIVIILLNLSNVGFLVLLNQWTSSFYNILQNYDSSGFFLSIRNFFFIGAGYVAVRVYAQYLQQMMEINWRKWLTDDFSSKWLAGKAYHYLQLKDNAPDNPDQRISEDIQLYVALTLQLVLGILKSLVTIASFGVILWNLSGVLPISAGGLTLQLPGYLIWAAIGYAAAGTWLADKIGRSLIALNYNQQKHEANYRFQLINIREYSETIAFYHSEQREQHYLSKRFLQLFDNFKMLMQRKKTLSWFTSAYGQLTFIFPFIIAAPQYFSQHGQLGVLVQTATAFGRVQDSLSFFINSYTLWAEWQAVAKRLTGFNDQINAEHNSTTTTTMPVTGQSLQTDGVTINRPDGSTLLRLPALALDKGQRLLISGPAGCGKSTLLRTLAALWPYYSGRIIMPPQQYTFFLAQNIYLPASTLRELLHYPAAQSPPDDQLRYILHLCQLDNYLDKLDHLAQWRNILSPGEQQQLLFARILVQKPQWLFMDEATSALDEDVEQILYQLLHLHLPDTAIISVSHRKNLQRYHHQHLEYRPEGWALRTL